VTSIVQDLAGAYARAGGGFAGSPVSIDQENGAVCPKERKSKSFSLSIHLISEERVLQEVRC
jgi:hypothetical protein